MSQDAHVPTLNYLENKANFFSVENLIHYFLTSVYISYSLSSVINEAVTHTQFPMY